MYCKENMDETKELLERTQVILAYVLNKVGAVEITREELENGLPENAVIAVDNDLERNLIVARLAVEE